MSEVFTTTIPEITSASFSINPATISAVTVLEVFVTEVTVVLEPESFFSGEIYSGEV